MYKCVCLLLLICFMGRVRGFSGQEICYDSKIVCVRSNPSVSCDVPSVCQESISNAFAVIDFSGNWTIYIVGYDDGSLSIFEEEVTLESHGTPENYLLRNVIKPFPGHRIKWINTGDKSNLKIQKFWWEISGSGGYLEFENPNTFTEPVSIIEIDVVNGGYGVILTDFVVKNKKDQLLTSLINFEECPLGILGVMISNVTIEDTGEPFLTAIDANCMCDICAENSYTQAFGEDKRLWIKNSRFLSGDTLQVIVGGFTVESNYFTTSSSVQTSITFTGEQENRFFFYNNVFYYPPTTGIDNVFRIYTDTPSSGSLIYNNDVIDETGQLKEFIMSSNGYPGCLSPVNSVYVYNNLINTTKISTCTPIFRCSEPCTANYKFSYNFQTSTACLLEKNWLDTENCGTVDDVESLGNNEGGLDMWKFKLEGEKPYPYFDLDLKGKLGVSEFGLVVPQRIPLYDYEGRIREGESTAGRTSIGSFECQNCIYDMLPLCMNPKTFCVGVGGDEICHFSSVQAAVDFVDAKDVERSGGYRIILVGENAVFRENVIIGSGAATVENVSLYNEISVYPGHSVTWMGDTEYSILEIEAFWWKITGGDGNLTFVGDPSLKENSNIIYVGVGGVLLEKFSVRNLRPKLLKIISLTCPEMVGVFINEVKFENTGVYAEYSLHTECQCVSCGSSSFTSLYGEEKRMWIKNCIFESGDNNLLGEKTHFTIEQNYFHVLQDQNSTVAPIHIKLNAVHEEFFIFNNVFHFEEGSSVETVLDFQYVDSSSSSHQRFYNNLIVDDSRSLTQLLRSRADADCGMTPQVFYIYNNLIQSEYCFPLVNCKYLLSTCTANIWFDYNHFSNESCEYSFWQTLLTCTGTSFFENNGHESVGEIHFLRTGEKPFPYFNISTDVPGMPSPPATPPFPGAPAAIVLPSNDYLGRPRPGPDLLSRTSIGAIEFECPPSCLGGADSRIDCQRESDCGCVSPFFGTTSCQFTFEGCPACSPKGNCSKNWETGLVFCSCSQWYYGELCDVTTCFGKFSNVTENGKNEPCGGSNSGKCMDHDKCNCKERFFGDNCNISFCNEILSNDTSVCSHNGDCVMEKCQCYPNYFGEDCEINECNHIIGNETEKVCSSHGLCIGYNNCTCDTSDYTGSDCEVYTCYNVSRQSFAEVCNGHGWCMDIDECFCFDGYLDDAEDDDESRSVCVDWFCFSVKKDDKEKVCSGRGNCKAPDTCDCTGKYEGDFCETWSCGIDYKFPSTCSGNGQCIKPEKCKCQAGFSGKLCQVNDLYLTVMAPVLGTAGIIASIVIIILCSCCVLIVCCCVCILIIACFGCVLLSSVVSFQKLRLGKFKKLKNVDILLQEQELEDDASVAHININKKMFEIDIKQIKVIKILGEGGSSSTVYLADWKNRKVAFKCFKTRNICSSQDNFNEFEKEVEVFSSISHPNIVSFYGCTMNPPRVGILMEFCSNGECLDFIQKYEKKNEKRYPMKERIRMLEEIISAVDYLHSRSIIHRDLKCENVLLDAAEQCKLMDFGLSKISERLSQQKNQTKRIGTSFFMAPEVTQGETNYDEKIDVFSFAIMAFIMLTGNSDPYGLGTLFNIESKVANNPSFRPNTKILKEYLSPNQRWLIPTIESGWKHDPTDRPSFEKLSKIFKDGSENEDFEFDEEEHDDDDDDDEKDGGGEISEQDSKRKEMEYEERIREFEEREKKWKRKEKKLKKELEKSRNEINLLKKSLEDLGGD